MIDINYQKRKNAELFKSLEKPDTHFLSKTQNFIPIYTRFFTLNDTNYNNVNLNPVSLNYIARKVGDKYTEWDETERRLREYGTYTNASRYFRLEMDADLDAGTIDPTYLPFGFFGPPRAKRFTFNSGSEIVSIALFRVL